VAFTVAYKIKSACLKETESGRALVRCLLFLPHLSKAVLPWVYVYRKRFFMYNGTHDSELKKMFWLTVYVSAYIEHRANAAMRRKYG